MNCEDNGLLFSFRGRRTPAAKANRERKSLIAALKALRHPNQGEDRSISSHKKRAASAGLAARLPAWTRSTLLTAGIGDPARTWDWAMSFIVVEELHFVIGLRIGHRLVIRRAEARRIIVERQRRLCGEHRLRVRRSGLRASYREHSEGIAVGVGHADVVGDHRSVVRDRQPAHTHR